MSSKLTWSKEVPTVSGWYWCKLPLSMHPNLVELSSSLGVLDGLYMNLDPVEYGTAMHIDEVVKRMKGIEWTGPLPEEYVPKV